MASFEVGQEVILTLGKGKKALKLNVVAVTEKDKLGRYRIRRKPRRKTKRT